MNLTRWAAVGLLGIGMAGGCGSDGGNGGNGGNNPGPRQLQVGGGYQINQQALTDTCGQTGTPIPVTATVTHTAGANTFTMSDTGGTNFTGTVQNNGDFTANATLTSGGQTFTQGLQGRFTATGFTATLSVQVAPQSCNFTRSWTATRQSGTNVFP